MKRNMGYSTTALILVLGLFVQNAWSASSSSSTTTTSKPPAKAEKRQSVEYYVQQDTPEQLYQTIQQQQQQQQQQQTPSDQPQPQQRYFRPSPQITPNQLSPEYVRLLQQLENQQVDSNGQQPSYLERGPQLFVGASQRTQPQRQLTIEQETQRQLQESIAQRGLREQEARDAQRYQQFSQLQAYQQQEAPFQPSLPPPQQIQAYARPIPSPQPQYVRPSVQPQYAPSYRVPEVPSRVSYSQVQFGSSSLPRQSRLVAPKPIPQQQIVYASPSPTPQQQIYRQEPVYDDSPPTRPNSYQADLAESQKATQQYLVETSNLDQPDQALLAIPKGRGQSGQVYYTTSSQQPHQTMYQFQPEQQSVYAHQHAQQFEPSPSPPPRSAIFVSSARVPQQAYRTESGKSDSRPLTQGELRALIDAGFRVSPVQEPSYGRPYDARELNKRQNPRLITRPVPLSPSERREYERHGIRNVYRVEPAENEDSPSVIRYVLAIGPPMG